MRSIYRSRRAIPILLVFVTPACLFLGSAESIASGDEKEPEPEFASPQLATLELFLGPWRVTEDHFDAKGEVMATVRGTEEVAWILDRHAIRRVYTTTTTSTVFRAIGTLTFSDAEDAYRGAWFDNASTSGPSLVKGEWDDKARTMVFTVEKRAKGGKVSRYRVVDRFTDDERRVVTTYMIDGNKNVKLVEVRYRRAIPCPDKLRGISDR